MTPQKTATTFPMKPTPAQAPNGETAVQPTVSNSWLIYPIWMVSI